MLSNCLLARKYSATITVQGDSATEYAGDYVTVGSDSARWIKPRTGIRQAVATTQLRRIRFLRRGRGALLGAAEGAAPGAVLGILSFIFAAPKHGETGLLQLLLVVFGAMCAFGGAVIGAVAGAIAGSKTDFLF